MRVHRGSQTQEADPLIAAKEAGIDASGNVKAANASGAYPPPSRAYKGEEILKLQRPNIKMTNNQTLTQSAFNAHVEYIKKMQRGTAGFTCWASIAGRRAGI